MSLGREHTSAIRLIFSLRSVSENPKSLLSPNRTLSPSKRYAAKPKCNRCCSSAVAIVDFPDAERPVNQTVKPRCLRRSLRSFRERDGCQVMLLCHVRRRWWGLVLAGYSSRRHCGIESEFEFTEEFWSWGMKRERFLYKKTKRVV
jgi:hypothetical protein